MYHVSWNTESGDRGSYFFRNNPTQEFLEKFFRNKHSEEYETTHPNIYWDTHKIKFEDDRVSVYYDNLNPLG